LKTLFVDGICELKNLVGKGNGRQTEPISDNLIENNTALETLKGESKIHNLDLDRQVTEQSAATTIGYLQNELNKNGYALKTWNEEIINLKSKIDLLTQQIFELEFVIAHIKSDIKRNERLAESYKRKITTMETNLREAEEVVRGKDMTIHLLQQALEDQKRVIDKQIN